MHFLNNVLLTVRKLFEKKFLCVKSLNLLIIRTTYYYIDMNSTVSGFDVIGSISWTIYFGKEIHEPEFKSK